MNPQEKRPRNYAAEAKAYSNNPKSQWEWIKQNAPEKYHAMIVRYMRLMK